MGYQEASVVFPDLATMITTTRPLLCIVNDQSTVVRYEALDLSVLVNGCLYLVRNDSDYLRAGDILSRNWQLSLNKGLDPCQLIQQIFVRYQSVYNARRGIGRIHGRYKSTEVPNLEQWRMDTDWLLCTSWRLERGSKKEAEFKWRAEQRVGKQAYDRDSHKVLARGLTAKAATLIDALGRRNTPSIPLQMDKADRVLQARIQGVRGIGRRMDWRAVVLEHVIDKLQNECRLIRRIAQEALIAEDIFGKKRTPNALRQRANRMRDHAAFLQEIPVRTFSRVFNHVARELLEAADLLTESASERSIQPLERVGRLLGTIYQSMVLSELHSRLQEILLVVAHVAKNKHELSKAQIDLFLEELQAVSDALIIKNPVTGIQMGDGFERNVIPTVIAEIQLAIESLKSAQAIRLVELYEHLKAACEPL